MTAQKDVMIREPLRSLLFVPGNRPDLMDKALVSGADALILDLEDATPEGQKATAREAVGAFIDGSRSRTHPALFVRVNGLASFELLADLAAVVRQGLRGVMLPMVVGTDQVTTVSYVLDCLERSAGLPLGTVAIVPLLETALGIKRAHELACASPRVAYMGGISSEGGDVARELGFQWSRDGWETLAMRAQALVDVRAAGVENPVSGVWTDIADVSGLRAFAEQSRGLGYEGMLCIHPSHVPVINAAFSLAEGDVQQAHEVITALETAAHDGRGAVSHNGKMIDAAMAETAKRNLKRSER